MPSVLEHIPNEKNKRGDIGYPVPNEYALQIDCRPSFSKSNLILVVYLAGKYRKISALDVEIKSNR